MVALRAGNLLVLPSRSESMPAVLVEAGLAQLPVVATRVQAVPEIVADGITGHLVDEPSVPALAAAIRRITSDRGHALELGRAGRRRCLERFTIAAVAPGWDDILERVARPR